MTNLNFIAGIVIVVICGIILAIRLFMNHKNGSKITMNDFIELYGNNIINVLKDVIDILKIDMSSYTTKEEYETVIIESTINILKENSIEFGIPEDIVTLFDTEALTKIITNIFSDNKCDILSILAISTIEANKDIIDEKVVESLTIEASK